MSTTGPAGRHPRGSVLVYVLILMTLLLALASLAVDYGRMQLTKAQLQRAADATARGTLQMWVNDGQTATNINSPLLATNTWNPVDDQSGVPQTVVITWGWWSSPLNAFVAGNGTPTAVRVTVSRTAANGNAVPLTFPLLSGGAALRTTCDISATATAVLTPAQTTTSTVSGKADLWLSGMPAGTTAGYSDTVANAPPTQAALTVTPGAVVTFTPTGQTSFTGSTANVGPDGTGGGQTHMANSPDGDYNGCQNGIQTITTPLCSLLGVFLANAQPNTQTPPASGLDYSTSTSRNQASYTALKNQQPFFIGDGKNSTSVRQSFVVPAGATRLYLGVFDAYGNNDNPGSLTVSVTQQAKVTLVR